MLLTIERVLFLRSVDLFARIANGDLIQVAQLLDEMHLSAGQMFIEQGALGDSLYITVEGDVDILVNGKPVARRGPRTVNGEMALLSARTRTASCVAATDVTLLRLAQDDFRDLLLEIPSLALGIIDVLIERLDEAGRKAAYDMPPSPL